MTATGLTSRNFEQFCSQERGRLPVVALTYLLHPVNIMKFGRDSSIMELVEQFIGDSYEEEMAIIMIRSLWSYLNRVDGFTEAAFLIADGDPHVGRPVGASQPSALQSLAIRLPHIPATSATSGNWSAFQLVHSWLRNRLTEDRVQKLVCVFGNFRLMEGGQYLDDNLEFFTSLCWDGRWFVCLICYFLYLIIILIKITY